MANQIKNSYLGYSTDQLRADYVFWKVARNEKNINKGTQWGRKIGTKFDNELHRNVKLSADSQLSKSDLIKAIKSVKMFKNAPDSLIKGYLDEFDNYIQNEDKLYFSPFSSDFQDSQKFLEHGGYACIVSPSDIDKLGNVEPKQKLKESKLGYSFIDEEGNIHDTGTLFRADVKDYWDNKGISPLFMYCNYTDDMNDVNEEREIKNAFFGRDNNGDEWNIDSRQMKMAEDILTTLRDNGAEFTIRGIPNHKGTLVAHVTKPSAFDVRFVDTPNYKKSMSGEATTIGTGRIYESTDGGIEGRFVSSKGNHENYTFTYAYADDKGMDSDFVKNKLYLYPICQALNISEPRGANFNTNSINSVKIAEGGYTKTLLNGYDGDNLIYKTTRSGTPGINPISDNQTKNISADKYISDAVNSARTNFTHKVDVEGLTKAAKEFTDCKEKDKTPERFFNFSNEDDVESVQRYMFSYLTGEQDHLLNAKDEYPKLIETHDDDANSNNAEYSDDFSNDDLTADTFARATNHDFTDNTPQNCEEFLKQFEDIHIGTYKEGMNLSDDMAKINPYNINIHMDKTLNNNATDNVTVLSYKIGVLGMDKKNLTDVAGNFENYKIINNSVRYDASSAKPLSEANNKSISNIYGIADNEIHNVINRFQGTLINEPTTDKNGIIEINVFTPTNDDRQPLTESAIRDWQQKYAVWEEKRNKYNADIVKYNNGELSQMPEKYGDAPRIKGYKKQTIRIGQVFDYDNKEYAEGKKVLLTNYKGNPNVAGVVVASNDAWFSDKGELLGDRLRGHNLEDTLKDRINTELTHAICKGNTELDITSVLDGIYYTAFTNKFDNENGQWRENLKEHGMTDELIDMKIRNGNQSVRARTRYEDTSKIGTTYHHEPAKNDEAHNNNYHNDQSDTKHIDLNTLSGEMRGTIDLSATGNAKTGGVAMELVNGAAIYPDKEPTKSEEEHCSLLSSRYFRHMQYDSVDRVIMALNNAKDCDRIADDVGYVQMDLGGWGFDDGMIISKSFADKYQVVDAKTHELRSLRVGDKISDFHGNKGVISLVVDPDMTEGAMSKQGVSKDIVNFFKDNKDVEVVAQPYSEIGRWNTGTAHEAMENPFDITVNGKTIEGGGGKLAMMILPQHSEVKSKISQTNGRKFGAQLSWMLTAKNAVHLANEIYGGNANAIIDLREYMMTIGADIDQYGSFKRNYTVQDGEDRYTFTIPTASELMKYKESKKGIRGWNSYLTKNGDIAQLKTKELTDAVMKKMSEQGGMLLLPKDLDFKMATGNDLPTVKEILDQTNGRDTMLLRTVKAQGIPESEYDNYHVLPIMSTFLRSGTKIYDGTTVDHDYTKDYKRIVENTIKYRIYSETPDGKTLSEEDRNKRLQECYRQITNGYNSIVNDLKARQLNPSYKHNVFREEIMSKNLNNSANLVVSENPTLDIGVAEISKATAIQMGLMNKHTRIDENGLLVRKNENNEDEYVNMAIWRDPALKTTALASFKVKISDRDIVGMAFNPIFDKPFDGDFDGDVYGAAVFKTEGARYDLERYYSPAMNLLNDGVARTNEPIRIPTGSTITINGQTFTDKDEFVPAVDFRTGKFIPRIGEDGKPMFKDGKPLYEPLRQFETNFQSGLDLTAGEVVNPKLRDMREELENRTNFEYAKAQYENTPYEIQKSINDGLIKEWSEYSKQAFKAATLVHNVSYKDPEAFLKSVVKYMNDGAKGNVSKYMDMCRYCGIRAIPGVDFVFKKPDNTIIDINQLEKVVGDRSDYDNNANQFILKNGKTIEIPEVDEKGNLTNFNDATDRILTIKLPKDKSLEVEIRKPVWLHQDHSTGKTEHDRVGSLTAMEIKTEATGLAGAISQKILASIRNVAEPRVIARALATTYIATQGVLQIKHDPEKGDNMYGLLKGTVQSLLKGHKLEKDDNGKWTVVTGKDGLFQSVDEFAKNIQEFWSDKNGFDTPIEYESAYMIAKALSPTTAVIVDKNSFTQKQLDMIEKGEQERKAKEIKQYKYSKDCSISSDGGFKYVKNDKLNRATKLTQSDLDNLIKVSKDEKGNEILTGKLIDLAKRNFCKEDIMIIKPNDPDADAKQEEFNNQDKDGVHKKCCIRIKANKDGTYNIDIKAPYRADFVNNISDISHYKTNDEIKRETELSKISRKEIKGDKVIISGNPETIQKAINWCNRNNKSYQEQVTIEGLHGNYLSKFETTPDRGAYITKDSDFKSFEKLINEEASIFTGAGRQYIPSIVEQNQFVDGFCNDKRVKDICSSKLTNEEKSQKLLNIAKKKSMEEFGWMLSGKKPIVAKDTQADYRSQKVKNRVEKNNSIHKGMKH